VSKTAEEDDPRPGLDYLMHEIPGYWDRRQTIIALLGYLSQKPSVNMEHLEKDAEAAHLLLEALEGDGVWIHRHSSRRCHFPLDKIGFYPHGERAFIK